MVYTGDAMTSPSPEVLSVPSACEPLPEGPSPRWRRSAEGLRWMRLAMYAVLAAYVLSTLLILIDQGAVLASSFVAYPVYAVFVLAYVAFAAGLWRFGSVPTSTGAARPARQSFMCYATGQALSVLCILPLMWPTPVLRTHGDLMIGLFVLWPIALMALYCAGLGLLVRALGAALRSLGETPPAWAPKAVGALSIWWILLIALPPALTFAFPSVLVDLPHGTLSMMGWVGMVAAGAFGLALASVMGRTAEVLARQESPESALR